jgi:SAM-dependent methyltransferase
LTGSALDRARTFNNVAAAYDAHRAGYPSDLFANLIAIAKLKPKDRVLEVGCGSGQATSGFVSVGLDVTGVDPGESLIELARSKYVGSAVVRFELASFEEWERNGRQYELVAAAQSWHWVRPDKGFAKAADALTPNGFITVFGHTPAWSASLIDILRPSYARLAPELFGPPPEAWYLPNGPIPDLIQASGSFGRVEHREYRWRRSYSATSFAAYLGTRSDRLLLPPERRAELLLAVERGLPASIEADWVTNLYLAPLK